MVGVSLLCLWHKQTRERAMDIKRGMQIQLTEVAPVSAKFLGCTATVLNVLPNAVVLNVAGHGAAIVHREWGLKPNGGSLGFKLI